MRILNSDHFGIPEADQMQNEPGYLRKTIWCIALVILIQLLKKYLDGILPGILIFHHFLLTLLQLVILVWTIILLLFPSVSFIKKILLFVGVLTLPELLCTYWLHHPSQIPDSLHSVIMRYSTQAENNILQFSSKNSVYNKDLFYILKPSFRFVFTNPEFADSFYTNKMGLRDDESSLLKPEVICLGDSYTMGWGVKQNETFAEQLGSSLHKKVLNAGITSYGTARELKNLYRLDTSGLQYIILQYCHNDYTENESFIKNNYSLQASPREKYDSLVNNNYWNMLWFPGKRFTCIAKFYLEKKLNPYLFPHKKPAADSVAAGLRQTAAYLTGILFHSAINFKKVKVFVVDLNQKELMNNELLNEMNKLINSPRYAPHFNNNLVMVPVSDLLTDDDYYILDPHLRPSGHRKIANRLAQYLFRQN